MFFDTHAHYDFEAFDDDRDALLASMPGSGVSLILNAGSSVENSRRGLEIAAKYPFMYAAVGVHPHDAAGMDSGSIPEMRELLKNPKARAVGEIGLDYHYDHSPRDVQRLRFREQLELAREVKKPVIIHEREAFADVTEILSDFGDLHGVFHCFSGDWDAAKKILDRGWLLSFTGVITFKTGALSLDVASRVPIDRLMLETDSPYLSPVPVRGKRNDSRNLLHTATKLAEARGISVEELAEKTLQNGKKFFGIEDDTQ
ncbi:MAG: TatD family hydrolase [Oscillospiraceae bacterium]|jgi:TatD DNase family protein|nr:TatD family hydrolase [Oscillospiraceae bacterium]